MIVRVFLPKATDPSDHSDFDGQDFEFTVMPQSGQTLTFTDTTVPSFEVEKVGFIQDGKAFVPAIWVKRDVDLDEWIASMRS